MHLRQIAYGAAGVLKANTFGVQWQPSRDAVPARQPLATLPSSTHGCRVYTVRDANAGGSHFLFGVVLY